MNQEASPNSWKTFWELFSLKFSREVVSLGILEGFNLAVICWYGLKVQPVAGVALALFVEGLGLANIYIIHSRNYRDFPKDSAKVEPSAT